MSVAELRRAGVVAVIRAPSADLAVRAVDALVAGGVTGIEITYSTPDAAVAIRRIDERYGDAIYLGAGTIRSAFQARESVDAGARFLVSPGTRPKIARAMLATGAQVYTGALTPTEIMSACDLGSHAVKIFPGSFAGPGYLRALRGPFPDVDFIPTGGVSPGTIEAWIDAGAIAIGAGGELCSAAAMRAGRWDDIRAAAEEFSAAARRARARVDA